MESSKKINQKPNFYQLMESALLSLKNRTSQTPYKKSWNFQSLGHTWFDLCEKFYQITLKGWFNW